MDGFSPRGGTLTEMRGSLARRRGWTSRLSIDVAGAANALSPELPGFENSGRNPRQSTLASNPRHNLQAAAAEIGGDV